MRKLKFIFFMAIIFCVSYTFALENGLGLVPIMGWNPWNLWQYQEQQFTEANMLKQAHAIKENGFIEAGYVYFNLDDWWMGEQRDGQGKLIGHPTRFPHGMPWFSDTMHAMGFKLGIYGDRGTMT